MIPILDFHKRCFETSHTPSGWLISFTICEAGHIIKEAIWLGIDPKEFRSVRRNLLKRLTPKAKYCVMTIQDWPPELHLIVLY